LKLLLQSDNFIGFQNAFMSMNHQNPTVKWSAFRKKRQSMLTASKRIHDPLAIKLVSWWVPEIICLCLQPTINLARMDAIQSKTTFIVVDKPPFSASSLPTLMQPRERG
jgi:hypothetical protein